MTKKRSDRYCMQCRKPMKVADRIEMGWSVMTGRIAVCSTKCKDAWNAGSATAWPRADEPKRRG